jgi:ankyrin repeat protein
VAASLTPTQEAFLAAEEGRLSEWLRNTGYPEGTGADWIDLRAAPEDFFGQSLLSSAAASDDLVAIQALARLLDVNLQSGDGSTALMAASRRPTDRACHALLQAGADPLLADVYGRDALRHAADEGSHHCVARLLGAGVQPSAGKSGRSALHYAVESRGAGALACVRLLLPLSDLGATNREGHTALELARKRGDMEIAGLIAAFRRSQLESRQLQLAACGPFVRSSPSRRAL